MAFSTRNPRARLVHHVQELERLEELKKAAADHLKDGFERAAAEGFDRDTLKVVLKLRKLTPEQRQERRAMEAIYLAALNMLEGDALPEEARRRLDEDSRAAKRDPKRPLPPPPPDQPPDILGGEVAEAPQEPPPVPEQAPLILKDPAEARQEGTDAAAAGKRIYDNPYPAGDPCRAAWDEGWCARQKSHGMDTPSAYQRRTARPPDDKRDKDGAAGSGDLEKGAA